MIRRRFLEQTSVRGAARIVLHKDRKLRRLWIASTVVFGVVTATHVAAIILSILKHEQISLRKEGHLLQLFLREDSQQAVVYPAGFLCNANPLASQTFSPDERTVPSMAEYVSLVSDAASTTPDVDERSLSYLRSYRGYFDHIGLKQASRVGHQKDNMVFVCEVLFYSTGGQMPSQRCKERDISRVTSPEFFNCYSLKVNLRDLSVGIPIGLSLILHLDDPMDSITDYFDMHLDTRQGHGMRFALSKELSVPDLWYSALDLSPGVTTEIHLNLLMRHRQGRPHGTCLDANGTQLYGLEGQELVYTTLGCQNACQMDQIAERCHCIDPALLATTSPSHLTLAYCGQFTDNLTHTCSRIRCAMEAKGAVFQECVQHCEPECFEQFFPKTTSSHDWLMEPHDLLNFYKSFIKGSSIEAAYTVYQDVLDLQRSGNETEAMQLLSKTKLIENNFVKLIIYLEDMHYTSITDTAKVGPSQAVSDIGGALNLYIGINLVFLLELLELLYHVIAKLCPARLKTGGAPESRAEPSHGSLESEPGKSAIAS